jgi:hypothetical protein
MQRDNEKANCTDRNSCRRAARDLISILWPAGRTEVATFDCWRAGMAGPVHAVPGANRAGGRFGRAAAETGGGRLTGCLAMAGRGERCRAETPASDVFQGRSQRFAALQLFGRLFRRQSQPVNVGQSCRWSVSRGRGMLFEKRARLQRRRDGCERVEGSRSKRRWPAVCFVSGGRCGRVWSAGRCGSLDMDNVRR